MADNRKMQNAKIEKNGEYYTEYSTISNEIGHYRDQFKGQVVYCNCDDPSWSNFWKYFHNNFASLGLKRLISTHYQEDTEPSYAMIYDGGDDFNMDAGKIVEIHGNTAVVNGKEVFYTAGDFRSEACLRYLDEATIVVTNPPFFLFREYMECLIDHKKKFLIIGSQNATTTKDIFPLFKDNKVWYGVSIHSGGIDFRIPDDYDEYSDKVFIKDGHHYINLPGIRWFTNMDVKYRHDGLWHKNGVFDNSQAHFYYEGNEGAYPSYVKYDAIDIGETKSNGKRKGRCDIVPIDFEGAMGVPITFLDKYNPDEFEILDARDFAKNEKQKRKTTLLVKDADGLVEGVKYPVYGHILIRNRNPIKKSDDLGY